MVYFGLKLGQHLVIRAAHPYQEFRGVHPPHPPGHASCRQLVREAREMVTTVNHDPFFAGSISTEQCGRPKLNNTREQLQFLLERRFNA